MKRSKRNETPVETKNMSKANHLVLQGLCGYVVGLAITSGLMLESGEFLFWLLIGLFLSGLPYGLRVSFFPDEPQIYYYDVSFLWMFISFLLKFAAAYFIGLFVYPVILLSTLFKAHREKRAAIKAGYSVGSPFQIFKTPEKVYTRRDCKKAIFKYAVYIIFLIASICVFTVSLADSRYRTFSLQGALAITGFAFLSFSVIYYILRVLKEVPGNLGGVAVCLGSMLVCTCFAVVLVSIMMVSLEHILGLGKWRTSELQKWKLIFSVGSVLTTYFSILFSVKLIYHIVHLGRVTKEETAWHTAEMERLFHEETEEEKEIRLAEARILQEQQRKSWEKMKQQRRAAERRKTANHSNDT